MKRLFKQILKPALALIFASVMLYSCEATVKIPKHPAPGQPPPPPKLKVENN